MTDPESITLLATCAEKYSMRWNVCGGMLVVSTVVTVFFFTAPHEVSGQQQRAQSDRSEVMLEALALQALMSDQVSKEKAIFCKYLTQHPKLILVRHFKSVCAEDKIPPSEAGCLRDYLGCLNKEAMLGSKPGVPEGATFDCDGRLKQCQINP